MKGATIKLGIIQSLVFANCFFYTFYHFDCIKIETITRYKCKDRNTSIAKQRNIIRYGLFSHEKNCLKKSCKIPIK